jgi:hypothetical protein
MTAKEAAKKIAANGMKQNEVSRFITRTGGRSVLDYIAIFAVFGIDQDTVWDAYEVWQDEEPV